MRFAFFLLLWAPAFAEELRFSLVTREQLTASMEKAQSKNADRLEQVRELFTTAGCTPREQLVKGQKLPNLICEIAGPEENVIVVGAHYDKVADSDGVIDNWTGAAILPALYQALRPNETAPRKHKIVFIAFAEEEKGLIGSKYYVSQIKKPERANYQAMINIDCLGLGPLSIWPNRADKHLVELLDHVAASMKTPIAGVNLDKVGMGDSFPFAEKKIPAIDFHSITQTTWPILHTPRDNANAFVIDDYWTSYRIITTYLAYLDQKLSAPPTAPQ
jgi:Zn-dependent M28 family amino/carboxypeptidase